MIQVVKVVAVIPCYNEEQNISDVVLEVNQFVGGVIVTDNNSSDNTIGEAMDAGAYVIRHFGKRGTGGNTKLGIDNALVMDCDIIVTLDGDGQHDPTELLKVIEPIKQGLADIVLGSRFIKGHNSKIPRYRAFGISVITWLYNLGNSNKLTDVQCCYRAFTREALEKIGITETGFTFSVETLVKARKLGMRIREAPVKVLYHRQFSQNSTLNPIVHGLSVAFGVIKWRIKTELFGVL